MAWLVVNPKFRSVLGDLGLDRFDTLMNLPGAIVNGHPDRHVARVSIGSGRDAIEAYLKRELRVRWRDRVRHSLMGWGLTSRSVREARALDVAAGAGIPCPEWIALGESATGGAFLLVREVSRAAPLPEWLRQHPDRAERVRLAGELGSVVARLHASHIGHGELFAKHVLVDPDGKVRALLDWQQARRRPFLTPRRRLRDLATLDATLPESLVSDPERGLFLRAYAGRAAAPLLAGRIRREALLLKRCRRIRKEPEAVAARPDEGILWLAGERLCTTTQFHRSLDGAGETWLRDLCTPFQRDEGSRVVRTPDGRAARLTWSRRSLVLQWMWKRLRGRPLHAPEVQEAGRIFLQMRAGKEVPELLAFGQRRLLPWRVEAFLLTAEAARDGEVRP